MSRPSGAPGSPGGVDAGRRLDIPADASGARILRALRKATLEIESDRSLSPERIEKLKAQLRKDALWRIAEQRRTGGDASWQTRSGWDTKRAMTLLRRDPRRARMFHALTRSRLSSGSISVATPRAPVGGMPAQMGAESPAPGSPLRRSRIPWALIAVVIVSAAALIIEIAIVSGRIGAQKETESEGGDAAGNPTPAAAGSGEAPSTGGAGLQSGVSPRSVRAMSTPQVAGEGAPQPAQVAPAVTPVLVQPESIPMSETQRAGRELRAEWQEFARSACQATDGEVDGSAAAASEADQLALPLRQVVLLERLLAVHASALALARGDDSKARFIMDTLPKSPSVQVAPRPQAQGEGSDAEDGRLEAELRKFPGASEGRAALLRVYRTRPMAPGPLDARTLVHEALKGPNRTGRSLAVAILMDRGLKSTAVLEAVEERFAELSADPALQELIRVMAATDAAPGERSSQARAELVRRILAARGSRMEQLNGAWQGLAATSAALSPGEVGDPIDGSGGGSIGQLIALTGALLREAADAAVARDPASQAQMGEIAARASRERQASTTALAQAIANARGLLTIDGTTLAVATPMGPDDDAPIALVTPAQNAQFDVEFLAQWEAGLTALRPQSAVDYLLLAEDVAEFAPDRQAVALASQLAMLAGALDPRGQGTSAALLLAELVPQDDPDHDQLVARWHGVAQRWSKVDLAGQSAQLDPSSMSPARRSAVIEAIAQLRRGLGRKALDLAGSPQNRDDFAALIAHAPGGMEEFERRASESVRGEGANLQRDFADALLRIEHALLVASSPTLCDEVTLGANDPRPDIPVGSAALLFGVDPARAIWRDGRWTTRD